MRVDDIEVVDIALRVPPQRAIVPAGVFDAFGWNPSTTLTVHLRTRPFQMRDIHTLTADNPPGMWFVVRDGARGLPTEAAEGHSAHPRLRDKRVLAPWAIDDATDGLFELGADATQIFSLWAESFAALFWGLHDWAHFHHHGPFEQRAWTELQCDLDALAWLAENADLLALDAALGHALVACIEGIGIRRFEQESLTFPLHTLREAVRLRTPWGTED